MLDILIIAKDFTIVLFQQYKLSYLHVNSKLLLTSHGTIASILLPVLWGCLGSDQSFYRIELCGRAWKRHPCILHRTFRHTCRWVCDATRWDTRAPSRKESLRSQLDLEKDKRHVNDSMKTKSFEWNQTCNTFRGHS